MEAKSGKRLMKYCRDYVVFDLETTGISCLSDRIVEISAIKVRDGLAEDTFTTLVNPKCPIPHSASAVHGITDDMVKDAPEIEEVLPAFLEFAGESVLAGHNIASFDMRFIDRYSMQLTGTCPGNDYVDTLPIARLVLPGLPHHRLTDLAAYYGISCEGAHRALNDCRMNYEVYECLGKELKNSTAFRTCAKCGQIMVRRSGRYGSFWGCGGYPDCRYTERE